MPEARETQIFLIRACLEEIDSKELKPKNDLAAISKQEIDKAASDL